ncbi:UDP-N-acetylglucosamine--N-acetylmuramyl-(pentapeptide) pyrophosphoryl-undecaprenol N-acetylglucosamine transferase [Desulfosarcina alkanivorans]|uniref:UDP-N-acetylglucosamine--N-acetylmuramyl-(pentapeptide) pyrophosphoryl-undecaprenol N-acetylglucosamine transferase n=1 Tax=Desulfosarcina alkanivorans TaxID=571177 RepID=A0A5K7Z080_9BACT|nr:undecaprenyldiphospho-muramoylpentapeptide beta-N-acetylglucosaminyltransferase [Desulfosarcina alkanivorans]BBO71894.1 UDP-N-acetylglucosamine--N-acetylmuramyl-(pentapeptide) pyrophosphoryl-undecaprenol N-acetylglucosamine transferase [Desulfosarcina alkanivorans]
MHGTESRQAWRPLNVVVAGGGTGGHLFPGIAVAGEFIVRNANSRVLFVGAGRPFEKKALALAGYPQRTIDIEGIKGKGGWARVRAAMKTPAALLHAAGILADVKADLVVGVGGYAAGPVALAAWLKGIPMVVCEQNTVPGITNRMLFPMARRIYVSFENTRGKIDPAKMRITGNPVRPQILAAAAIGADQRDPFTVMVVGGSQGAHAINQAVMAALPLVRSSANIRFVHQTGAADQDQVAAAYLKTGIDAEVKAFFNDMASRYGQADLVVCRAGATTVAELTALGKPALLIPYPFAADNHQELNARTMVDRGAAQMVLERDLSGSGLAQCFDRFAGGPDLLADMASRSRALGKPEAARVIVDDCYQLVGNQACI